VKNIKGTCRFTPYRKLYQQIYNLSIYPLGSYEKLNTRVLIPYISAI
jgi:hypothetical protein